MNAIRLTVTISGLCLAAAAIAQQPADDAGIPPQLLNKALERFADTSGLQIIYVAQLAKGKETLGAEAGASNAETLDQLLANTGLEYEFLNANTITIQPAEEEGSSDSGNSRTTPTPIMMAQASMEMKHKITDESSADDSSDKLQEGIPEILVRGKRGSLNMDIRRTRDDVLPYVVFDSETIERSGASDLEDFLKQRLPMNTQALAHGQSPAISGNRSQVNLRGLGTNQTLILIDGRRVMGNIQPGSGAPGQPDINGIPLAAIERIEVLPASASGIYGGGATGGVINIIMKRDFQGSEVRLSYDNSFDTDTARKRVDLNTGFSLEGGRTDVLIAGSYSIANDIRVGDRSFMSERRIRTYENNPAGFLPPNPPPLGATANIRSATMVGGVLQNLTLKDGTPLGHTFTSAPAGYAGAGVDGGAALVGNAGRYNLDLASSAQVSGGAWESLANAPTIKSISATVRREFTPRIQAFVAAAASENIGHYAVSGLASSVMMLPSSAPTNPFQQDILVAVPITTADGEMVTHSRDRRLTAGVIFRLPHEWHGEIDYSISRPKFSIVAPAGYGAGLTPAGAMAVQNGTLDILRDPTAAEVDFSPYLYEGLSGTTVARLKNTSLRLAGPTFSLPAGPVMVSFLAERRDETYDDYTFYLGPIRIYAPKQTQTVESAYVEARIPLVSSRNSKPLLKSLELQVAGRYDRYELTSGTIVTLTPTPAPIIRGNSSLESANPTVGLRWQPAEDLMLRMSYSTGFLPPAVSQIVKTPSTNPTPLTIVDPQRGNTAYVVPLWYGGGNPDLEPEKSENWSAGAVLTPRFAPGLRVSVDYTRVKFTDRISSINPQFVVDNENRFPGRLTRGASLPGDLPGWAGPITVLDASLLNLAEAEIEAYDVQLDYSFDAGRAGTFDLFALGTWQTHYKTQATPDAPYLENVGYSFRPTKFKANAGATWRHDNWSVGWNVRYVGAYRSYNPSSSAGVIARAILNQGNGGWVDDQIYHDLFASYWLGNAPWGGELLSGLEIQAGANNVLNTRPPFDSQTRGYSTYGDPRLASYYLNLTKRF